MRRISLRLRLTLAFSVGMAVVLFTLAVVLHARFKADLTGGIDMELRSRIQVILAAIDHQDPSVIRAGGNLIDPDEAFAQVLSANGVIVDTSRGVAGGPMLLPSQLRSVSNPPRSVTTRVVGVDDPVRLLAVPTHRAGESLFVVVGSTLGDRNEALARLSLLLATFGSAALAVLSMGGWLLAGAALRPVERMRREASAISRSELDRRLQLPPARDELARLGSTLNDLLARLEDAFRQEGRFLDQASHELRTPLAVLKMELDLAASQAKSPEEMRQALVNASAETDRLVRLAEDLLVLARVSGGRLPVRRMPVDLRDLVGNACMAHEARARAAGSTIVWTAEEVFVSVDPSRVRQALEDLLDNALRFGRGSPIEVSAEVAGPAARITVRDHGPGFSPVAQRRAFEPFLHGDPEGGEGAEEETAGAGLGLTIARAVAEAHGGSVDLDNAKGGGALVTLTLRIPRAETPWRRPKEEEEEVEGPPEPAQPAGTWSSHSTTGASRHRFSSR